MSQKILFICSVNKQRSKTAEDYFSLKFADLEFQSAGTNITQCEREGTNPLRLNMILWADIIYVMENKHRKYILNNFGTLHQKKIVVLHIEDKYKYYQKELIEILETKIEDFF